MIKNNIELLSIHIPKTGGSSFQKSLQALYGEDAVLRLDFTVRDTAEGPRMVATNRTSQELLDQIYSEEQLSPTIRVLHGHFHYQNFVRFFDLPENARVVTWLRHPIARIVSNYHYLVASFHREVQHTPLSSKLFKRLVKSLPEFAAQPRDVNLYSDYLRGRRLSEFDFVGIIEAYDSELDRLGSILGMGEVTHFKVNRAAKPAPALLPQQEIALQAHNSENLDIYNEALALSTGRKPASQG